MLRRIKRLFFIGLVFLIVGILAALWFSAWHILCQGYPS